MIDTFFTSQDSRMHGIIMHAQTESSHGVVLCPPHPAYGGSMHNNVILALEAVLSDSGFTTLRFNYRGTGRSEGTFDGLTSASADVAAAIATLDADISIRQISVAGYSFGAMAALSACESDPRVSSLACIAPLTTFERFIYPRSFPKPVLFISPSHDEFSSAAEIQKIASAAGAQFALIPGADHFLLGREHDIAAKIAEFLT